MITIEGKAVVLPDAEVWMTAGELASLFYVRGVSVEAAIRKLKKDGIVDGGSCRRIASGLPVGRHVPRKSLRSCSCTIRTGHVAEPHRHVPK